MLSELAKFTCKAPAWWFCESSIVCMFPLRHPYSSRYFTCFGFSSKLQFLLIYRSKWTQIVPVDDATHVFLYCAGWWWRTFENSSSGMFGLVRWYCQYSILARSLSGQPFWKFFIIHAPRCKDGGEISEEPWSRILKYLFGNWLSHMRKQKLQNVLMAFLFQAVLQYLWPCFLLFKTFTKVWT